MEIQEFGQLRGDVVRRLEAIRREVYQDDEYYCPPFEGSLERELKRPEFAERQRIFLARRPGRDVGFVVARRPRRLLLEGEAVGTLGNFEAVRDEEAVGRMLLRAMEWLRGQGASRVIGPMNGDTWHEYRFSVGPYEERPFLKEPYQPIYYPELWKAVGFEPIAGYHSRCVEEVQEVARRHRPQWARARALGYRAEPMTKAPLNEVLDRIHEMVQVIFADAFLFTPIGRESFRRLYDGSEALLDGRLCFFLVDEKGDDAAFAFVFPDVFEAVQAMGGRRSLWAKARFVAKRRRARAANIKTVGVMPGHRGRGLSSAMAHLYFKGMEQMGIERGNLCLMSDGNLSTSIDAGLGRVTRRYELLEGPR